MKKNSVSALVVAAIVLLSPVWRGGRDTPLLGFSPTQLRPLWNHCRGRTALFLSPNWFSCSGCCASDFVAARPSPSQRPLPASGRFGDLSSFSAPPRRSFPSQQPAADRPGWAPAGLCRMLIATGADRAAGSDSPRRREPGSREPLGPRQPLIVHPPVSPALGNRVPQRNFISWNAARLNMFAQCAPSEEGLGLQTLLLGGKDIYTPAFSASPPPQVDGLQTEAFGEGDLPEGLGEISLFADAKAQGRMCSLRLSLPSLSLKCWELFQHQGVPFTSPFPVPSE